MHRIGSASRAEQGFDIKVLFIRIITSHHSQITNIWNGKAVGNIILQKCVCLAKLVSLLLLSEEDPTWVMGGKIGR